MDSQLGRNIHEHEAKHSRPTKEVVKGAGLPRKTMAFFIALFVVTYLSVINQNAVQGFAVRDAERSLASAKEENQQLRIEEAQLRSLGRIMEAKDRFGLIEVAPENKSMISYVSLREPLAMR